MNSATGTSLETESARGGLTRRPLQRKPSESRTPSETKALRRAFQKKYRHVAAMHAESRPSCLSHDAAASPSFLGFRNLMVIVLGRAPPVLAPVAPRLTERAQWLETFAS